LLQLERGAEIHEVELVARGELLPRAVDVLLSRGSVHNTSPGNDVFEQVGTVRFDDVGPQCRMPGPRTERLKLFALSTGQVRLVIHEPMSGVAHNPYRQVSLAAVELWGLEDVCANKPPRLAPTRPGLDAASLGGDVGDVAQVLTEIGVPLNILPIDEEAHWFSEVDVVTRRLLLELQGRQARLINDSQFGEAQQVSEHMQHMCTLGVELRRLLEARERLAGARRLEEADRLAPLIRELEESRLSVAALYETDFWIDQMAVQPSGSVDTEG